MANTLGRTIAPGEVVIVAREYLAAGNDRPEDRAFRCQGGFGMHAFTSGSAIIGEWLDGSTAGETDRIQGHWISPRETAAWQARHASAEEAPCLMCGAVGTWDQDSGSCTACRRPWMEAPEC